MRSARWGCVILLVAGTVAAQEKPAATVNGQVIAESAVARGLKKVPDAQKADARSQILDYLIANTLIDQYLVQMKTDVPTAEVDARIELMRAEAKKSNLDFDKTLQNLSVTEPELREQVTAELRWEKFSTAQATDKVLREVFERNPEMFDGSTVHARHVLLTPADSTPETMEKTKARIVALAKEIKDETDREMAKLPPGGDSTAREQAQHAVVDKVFAGIATRESNCPSKTQGGDVGWFPRVGSMVEPFAATAFTINKFQPSEPVQTQFGWHLILVTERRSGKQTAFEEVKDIVRDVYGDRLRDYLISQLKPRAQIQITK